MSYNTYLRRHLHNTLFLIIYYNNIIRHSCRNIFKRVYLSDPKSQLGIIKRVHTRVITSLSQVFIIATVIRVVTNARGAHTPPSLCTYIQRSRVCASVWGREILNIRRSVGPHLLFTYNGIPANCARVATASERDAPREAGVRKREGTRETRHT